MPSCRERSQNREEFRPKSQRESREERRSVVGGCWKPEPRRRERYRGDSRDIRLRKRDPKIVKRLGYSSQRVRERAERRGEEERRRLRLKAWTSTERDLWEGTKGEAGGTWETVTYKGFFIFFVGLRDFLIRSNLLFLNRNREFPVPLPECP